MINSLTANTLSQYGFEKQSPIAARHKAGLLFSRLLSRARRRNFWHKLLGKENQLQSLNSVEGDRYPAKQQTAVNIPLQKIVGSEARTADFDNQFNPLHAHNEERWVGIASARRQRVPLPPIDVIQAGDSYFVRDGHHRVSVAKAMGQAEIEANILFIIDVTPSH